MVAMRAIVMATPPRRGMGVFCRSRPRRGGTMPKRRHVQRTMGVSRIVRAIAMEASST